MEVREQIALFEAAQEKAYRAEFGGAASAVATRTRQRLFGAYYTPRSAADLMADWVVRGDGDVILEPSFGDGAFIRAVSRSVDSKRLEGVKIIGVEIDDKVQLKLNVELSGCKVEAVTSDFLDTAFHCVDGVIGNPPYVRLRHLESKQRSGALRVARESLGHEMATSGSLWMPFVLHAMKSLRPNGRLAMVLPYEFTYVKYALPLWHKLARSFSSLEVERSKERLFPDVMQEVVILYADGYGGTTDTVRFRAFDTISDLIQGDASVSRAVPIDDLLTGERAFVKALLSDQLIALLDRMLPERTQKAEIMAKIRIGYVTGDKGFFHPDPETIERFSIRKENLVEAITSTKSLASAGVRTSTVPRESVAKLFLPQSAPTPSEVSYIKAGETRGVQKRYKCRIRNPWYVVPGVNTPDLIMSVFSERPLVMLNDAGYAASNSLICGYVKAGFDAKSIVAAWYTSLTLLQCEMEIHSLGGGVMVLIPGEANKIRLPPSVRYEDQHLSSLDDLLTRSKSDEAYRAGDRFVLENQLKMTPSEVELLREGIQTLSEWRTAHRG